MQNIHSRLALFKIRVFHFFTLPVGILGNFGATTTMPLSTSKAKKQNKTKNPHPLLFTGKTGVLYQETKLVLETPGILQLFQSHQGAVRFREKYFFHF